MIERMARGYTDYRAFYGSSYPREMVLGDIMDAESFIKSKVRLDHPMHYFDASPYLTSKDAWYLPDYDGLNWMERLAAEILNREFDTQTFWRCKHYPSAIENWRAKYELPASHPDARVGCEHGCNLNELRWYDHGCHQPPTSSK
jgi:hypothetical protein